MDQCSRHDIPPAVRGDLTNQQGHDLNVGLKALGPSVLTCQRLGDHPHSHGQGGRSPLGTVRPFTRRQVIVERDAKPLEHGRKPFPNPISPTVVDHPDRRLAVFGSHRDVCDLFGIVGKEPAARRTNRQQSADLRATNLPFSHFHTGNVRHWEAVGEPQFTVTDVSVFDPEVLSVTAKRLVAAVILAMDRKDELHASRRFPS
jgi:hypothetical protein